MTAKTLTARSGSTIGAAAVIGGSALAYAMWEAKQYRLREVSVACLPAGADPVRVLQLSDIHMTPSQEKKRQWIRSLAELKPDLVIATGDFYSHELATPWILAALEPLLDVPGLFVLGSNDYFSPKPINPMKYFTGPSKVSRTVPDLPWQDLTGMLVTSGWTDLSNRRSQLSIGDVRIDVRGVDDPHIQRDRYDLVAGAYDDTAHLRLGVTHAPYLRVLDAMEADGADLIVAGHTHGGQVCIPGYGALVTNCDLDRARVKGLSAHKSAALHVSAGLGTSRFAQIRVACPPEATLLTLTSSQSSIDR